MDNMSSGGNIRSLLNASIQQQSELFNAARDNNLTSLRQILTTTSSIIAKISLLNEVDDQSGQAPLHAACAAGWYDVVNLLVREGCDVNLQDRNGNTALHLTTSISIFNCLLRVDGIVINKQNKNGETPLHRAVLMRMGKGMVKKLLRKGFSPSIRNKSGLSPFHVAVVNGLHTEAEAFVEIQNNIVEQMTDDGEMPIWLAVKHNRIGILKSLVNIKANINALHEKYGTTVLWLAVDLQNEAAVEYLLSLYANTNSILDFGNEDSSPLLLAFIKENETIKQKILGKIDLKWKILFDLYQDIQTVDPNYRDEYGNSILHLAVMSDSCKVVREMLSIWNNKTDTNTNSMGKTPTQLASERGIAELINILETSQDSEYPTLTTFNNRVIARIVKFLKGRQEGKSVTLKFMETISLLSNKFPLFTETKQVMIEVKPNKLNDVPIEEIKKFIIENIDINFQSNQTKCLADRELHWPKINDNPDTILVKSILKIIHDIENYLNKKHALFKLLSVAFFPVGSIAEGTKIRPLNEMDFVTKFRMFDGHLTVADEKTLIISQDKYNSLHPNVQDLFVELKLDLLKFFVAFISAVGEAIENIEEWPDNIKKNTIICNEEECKDSKFVHLIRKQCNHIGKIPQCVCFTKVGAGLNFVYEDPTNKTSLHFTVDLVITFHCLFQKQYISSSVHLRQKIMYSALTEFPLGWKEFLFKYIIQDRANLEILVDCENEITISIKMIGNTGNFILRPGRLLNVGKTFSNKNQLSAYCWLKILQVLTKSKVKSYTLKKVVCELDIDYIKEVNCYEIVKMALQHKELIGKFGNILDSLGENYTGIDLKDFPKVVNDKQYLHFIHKKAKLLHDNIQQGNESGIKFLSQAIRNEDAYSMYGKFPLHSACATAVPNINIMENLLSAGCNVDRQNLQGNTPMHLLICKNSTSLETLQILLKKNPNFKVQSKCGRNIVETGIVKLFETDKNLGKDEKNCFENYCNER